MPLIILFLLGLNGCLGQTAANQQTKSPDSIDALRDRLSQVRDLKFIAGVPVVEGTKETIKAFFDSDLQQNMEGKKLEDVSLAYAKLGLYVKESINWNAAN